MVTLYFPTVHFHSIRIKERVEHHVYAQQEQNIFHLTPSIPALPNCCCSKGSAPYWSNEPFLIFDIRALWRSVLSARVPECQNLKTVG